MAHVISPLDPRCWCGSTWRIPPVKCWMGFKKQPWMTYQSCPILYPISFIIYTRDHIWYPIIIFPIVSHTIANGHIHIEWLVFSPVCAQINLFDFCIEKNRPFSLPATLIYHIASYTSDVSQHISHVLSHIVGFRSISWSNAWPNPPDVWSSKCTDPRQPEWFFF